jgi:hypothetical protein
MLPAVLLTMLFYLDQNISVRAVNACNLKKVREADKDTDTESWIDVLRCAVLCCAVLCCVVLHDVVLCCVVQHDIVSCCVGGLTDRRAK